jgi:N-acetylated-alpha-linked acidic dipeptidase
MRPSKPGAERIPLDEVQTLQAIPVLPISYGDAEPILRHLGGPTVPAAWRGGLPIAYHVGPGPARVRMRLRFDWSVRPIVNVIGILRGSDAPEKIVMAGGHRDAWTFGGRDPISGAVSLLESARALGALAQQGHRPKRSIAIASWDAEEYGLIGSTEYGEEFGAELQQNLVVYLNRESYTAGDFGAAGVHALQPFVNEVARAVQMPDGDRTVFDSWAGSVGERGMRHTHVEPQVRLGALGSGSDYTVFLDHLGIPSVNLGFSSGNGIYHSRYDTHWFYTTYGDRDFAYGEKLAEVVALFLHRMANADELARRHLADEVDLSGVWRAAERMGGAGVTLAAEVERLLALNETALRSHSDALGRINDLLVRAEQGFLRLEGLPGRPWYRHQVYAPGFYTGYGVKTLPGVREAIEQGDGATAQQMADALERALNRVREALVEAIVEAAAVR